jgi:Tfp pilus assembly protein PilF
VLTKQNLTAEAVAERKKAAELMRTNMNHQRAEVATNSGNAMLKNGDMAAAAERFRDALTYDPNYRDAHLGLAQVLDRQGKPDEASAERRLAVPPKEVPNR